MNIEELITGAGDDTIKLNAIGVVQADEALMAYARRKQRKCEAAGVPFKWNSGDNAHVVIELVKALWPSLATDEEKGKRIALMAGLRHKTIAGNASALSKTKEIAAMLSPGGSTIDLDF